MLKNKMIMRLICLFVSGKPVRSDKNVYIIFQVFSCI